MSESYRIRWTANAKADLPNIVGYIKEESADAAKNVYNRLREKAQSIKLFPLRGRVVPELHKEGIILYREIVTPPYRIIYKIENDTIYIMAIFDSRQNVEEILWRKLMSRNP